jgi:hypothetical protein
MAIRWNVVTAAFALSCVMVGASAADVRPTAILQSASGSPAIFELTHGELRNASSVGIGRHYELPMEIQTGSADSATFLLPNSIIEVLPNSLMRIVAPEANDVGVVQRVLQHTGSSLFRVHRGTIDRFQVETPFLVSVVKGTVFNVLVRDDGTTVSLQEGRLQVNSLDATQSVELFPGDVAFSGRDGALRMIKLELTSSGAKARESVAVKAVDGEIRTIDTKDIVQSDASPVVRMTDSVTTVVSTVAVPVEGIVEPVVDSVVDAVVAPVVDSVVAPVIDTTVAPVIDTTVAPVIDTVVTPLLDTTVTPLVDTVVAPVTGSVVSSVGGTVSSRLGRH